MLPGLGARSSPADDRSRRGCSLSGQGACLPVPASTEHPLLAGTALPRRAERVRLSGRSWRTRARRAGRRRTAASSTAAIAPAVYSTEWISRITERAVPSRSAGRVVLGRFGRRRAAVSGAAARPRARQRFRSGKMLGSIADETWWRCAGSHRRVVVACRAPVAGKTARSPGALGTPKRNGVAATVALVGQTYGASRRRRTIQRPQCAARVLRRPASPASDRALQ